MINEPRRPRVDGPRRSRALMPTCVDARAPEVGVVLKGSADRLRRYAPRASDEKRIARPRVYRECSTGIGYGCYSEAWRGDGVASASLTVTAASTTSRLALSKAGGSFSKLDAVLERSNGPPPRLIAAALSRRPF